MLNFSNFKPVATGNTRENVHFTKGQSFNFKFKKFISKKEGKVKEETNFTISDKLFDSLGLETKGLIELVSPEGVSYLGVVDSDNAVFLRNRKSLKEGNVKGKKFKSTIFEKALSEQGIINLDLVGTTQKLDLKLAEGSESAVVGEGDKAIQTYGIYEIIKAENAELTEDEKAEDAASNDDTTEDVAEEPTEEIGAAPEESQASAPQGDAPSAPAINEDDF